LQPGLWAVDIGDDVPTEIERAVRLSGAFSLDDLGQAVTAGMDY
jgi:hypothetical protein